MDKQNTLIKPLDVKWKKKKPQDNEKVEAREIVDDSKVRKEEHNNIENLNLDEN